MECSENKLQDITIAIDNTVPLPEIKKINEVVKEIPLRICDVSPEDFVLIFKKQFRVQDVDVQPSFR
jgi:hypothetical protein